ncbi:P-loop containing nucleoside triphosphate hydrolase protein [Biscogniauxia mediterranea]|nr:P-loop containing nucleoside triphosphate hydrolase protein [Biscogniauxia mediterranea]
MRPLVAAPICPSCLFTTTAHSVLPSARHQRPSPWATQRLYTRHARPPPSRMVLSDRVSRDPESESDERGGKRSSRSPAGPFGGMNRTSVPSMLNAAPRHQRDNPGASSRREDKGEGDGRRIKAMKMQSMLASISYEQRSRTKEEIQDIDSFDKFDLLPSVKEAVSSEALKGMVYVKPTPIQRLAIPALLGTDTRRRSRTAADGSSERQEFLLAAETGSGKTLAYLLPAINALKQAEAADPAIAAHKESYIKQWKAMRLPGYTGPRELEPHPTMARPKVVVLVPTAELVEQVGKVAKALSHAIKFKISMFSANITAKIIHCNMYSPKGIDMVVATPHLLSSMADSDPFILSRVTHLVVDEADSLFDRSFAPETTAILDRAMPTLKQLILCSATIPQRLEKFCNSEFPDMRRITTPNLHAIPRRVQLGVIDVTRDPYRDNKNLACADAIWTIGKDAAQTQTFAGAGHNDMKHIIVFVNERERTQEVADYLVSKGIHAVALHRDTPEQRQSEMLESFTRIETPSSQEDSDAQDEEPKQQQPRMATHISPPGKGRRPLLNTRVLVATDLASRGIDTLAVRHVILYDVPHTTIDFIHRLGRAGRMGRRGRGIVLVGRDDRRDIVAEVKESMFMGKALI